MGMIYAVQKPRRNIDLTPALEFGSVEYLMEAEQLAGDTREAKELLEFRLRDFGDEDYLLCIGDPAAIALAAVVAATQNGGRVAILKWDRRQEFYYPTYIRVE